MNTLMTYNKKPQNYFPNIFDTFFHDDFFTLNSSESEKIKYDLGERDGEYLINISLAGFNKNDVAIDIEDNALQIKGERNDDENITYSAKGTFYGKFEKSFTLPDDIDEKKIDASFKDGILSIKIPKITEKKKLSKTIEIK